MKNNALWLKEGRSLNVLYDIETEASLRGFTNDIYYFYNIRIRKNQKFLI
jgi:hypothetical protein